MRQRGVASTLTALSMALGVAAMIGVIVIHSVAVRQFSSDAQGYHLIVGGKGGDTQLVLSTVFHLGQARYTIPYSFYREFTDGRHASLVQTAVPYCLGDSFDTSRGEEDSGGDLFRVVATTPDLFDTLSYGADSEGNPLSYGFREGRNFKADRPFEAVLGSVVAAKSGVRVGDTINPTHGIGGTGDRHDDFKVVGVLEPTGTANDRAVFVNIEGFYLLDGHALSPESDGAKSTEPANRGPVGQPQIADPRGVLPPPVLYDNEGNEIQPLPEAQREVSSILVLCNSVIGPQVLATTINKDPDRSFQAVAPARIVEGLMQNTVKPIQVVLLVLTVLIVIVASISILVSIYNSMSERSHDIAVMRALGASRTAVMLVVLGESVLLSLAGGVAGIALGHALVAAAAPYVEDQTGIRLAFWEFDPWELAVIPSLVVLAALAGLLPAISAYRTDVAKSLSGAR